MFREPKQVVELDQAATRWTSAGSASLSTTAPATPGDRWFSEEGRSRHRRYLVLTGDTLFERSVGRTDLFGGSGRDLIRSIVDKLLVLDDQTVMPCPDTVVR